MGIVYHQAPKKKRRFLALFLSIMNFVQIDGAAALSEKPFHTGTPLVTAIFIASSEGVSIAPFSLLFKHPGKKMPGLLPAEKFYASFVTESAVLV